MDSWLHSVNDGARGGGTARGDHRYGRWAPPAGLVGLAWVGACIAAGWCAVQVATHADPAGILLAAIATAGLGLAAVYGTRARPRLRVDTTGVSVGGLAGPRHHRWEQVRDVRVLAVRRLGRDSTLLEIDLAEPDGTERLMIFGRLDLGDDPVDVADAVRAARPG